MKNQFIDFEGNFGSQNQALQPMAEDYAAFSRITQEQKQLRTAEAAAKHRAAPRTPARKAA